MQSERARPAETPSTVPASASGEPPTPERLLMLGSQYRGAKALLSAVELGLFTELARGPLDTETLRRQIGIHQRGARDFFDALVALGVLERSDDRYANSAEADAFLDRGKPSYVDGFLEMSGASSYPIWGSLTEGLRTGRPQRKAGEPEDLFAGWYSDPARVRESVQAMTGLSLGPATAIARAFPWSRYQTAIDIGCAQGALSVQLARSHPHLTGGGFDLPPVQPVFEEHVASFGLDHRLRFHAGDFFVDPLPRADVLVMGHILHDWDLDQKRLLIAKAYEALPADGALVVYDAMIDDERRENSFGLLMSLTMLLRTPGGFDYTGADCRAWLGEAGFRDTHVEPLTETHSMAVGVK